MNQKEQNNARKENFIFCFIEVSVALLSEK
jgi:hypothetical protein